MIYFLDLGGVDDNCLNHIIKHQQELLAMCIAQDFVISINPFLIVERKQSIQLLDYLSMKF